MTAIIETAAVAAVTASAATTMGLAGFGHARGFQTDPRAISPGANNTVGVATSSGGTLTAAGVKCTLPGKPTETVSVEFNGEVLHVTKPNGVFSPTMHLGACTVTREGTTVTATSRADAPSSLQLGFQTDSDAAAWTQEMQVASEMCSHHTRIQELINHVLHREKLIKNLQERAAKVNELEEDKRKLHKKLAASGEGEGEKKEKKEEKKEGGKAAGDSKEEGIACSSPIEAAKAILGGEEAIVEQLKVELEGLKAQVAMASAQIDTPGLTAPEQATLEARLSSAEAKKNEVDAIISQLADRLGSGGSTSVMAQELEDETNRLYDRMTAISGGATGKTQVLKNQADELNKRVTQMEALREFPPLTEDQEVRLERAASNHDKVDAKAAELEARLEKLQKTQEDIINAKADLKQKGFEADPNDNVLVSAQLSYKELMVYSDALAQRVEALGTSDVVAMKIAMAKYEETDAFAKSLQQRLEDLETKSSPDINAKAEELTRRLDVIEKRGGADGATTLAKEVNMKAKELEDRLSNLEKNRGQAVSQDVTTKAKDLEARLSNLEKNGGQAVSQDLTTSSRELELKTQELEERAAQIDKELVGRLSVAEGERKELEDITGSLFARLANLEKAQPLTPRQQASPVSSGIAVETHQALQRDFQILQEAHDTAKTQLAASSETISVQRSASERLQQQVQDLRQQAPVAQAPAAQVDSSELEGYVKRLQEELDNCQGQLQQYEGQVNQHEEANRTLRAQIDENFERTLNTEGTLNVQIEQLTQALQQAQAQAATADVKSPGSPMQDPMVLILNQEKEAMKLQLNDLEENYKFVQREAAEQCKEAEDKKTASESMQQQQAQKIMELERYLDQSMKIAADDEALLVEREQWEQKLVSAEEQKAMLTKEFEVEYAELRRKEAQMDRMLQEEKFRASSLEAEASNARLLQEEKNVMLMEMDDMKTAAMDDMKIEHGNLQASNFELQRKVRESETTLAQMQEDNRRALDNALSEARLNSQRDFQQMQELELQVKRLQGNSGQAAQSQANQMLVQAAQNKADELYQEVVRLSATNDQLKAEQTYLVQELESKRFEPVREGVTVDHSALISKLSEENSDLKAQLAQTWAKINDQTKKIEEERSRFWEELETVRLTAAPVGGANLEFETFAPQVPSTVSPNQSPLTTGFGQQQQQQRSPLGTVRPEVRPGHARPTNTVAGRSAAPQVQQMQAPSRPSTGAPPSRNAGQPGVSRAVPTRAAGSTQPRTAGGMVMEQPVGATRPGVGYRSAYASQR